MIKLSLPRPVEPCNISRNIDVLAKVHEQGECTVTNWIHNLVALSHLHPCKELANDLYYGGAVMPEGSIFKEYNYEFLKFYKGWTVYLTQKLFRLNHNGMYSIFMAPQRFRLPLSVLIHHLGQKFNFPFYPFVVSHSGLKALKVVCQRLRTLKICVTKTVNTRVLNKHLIQSCLFLMSDNVLLK